MNSEQQSVINELLKGAPGYSLQLSSIKPDRNQINGQPTKKVQTQAFNTQELKPYITDSIKKQKSTSTTINPKQKPIETQVLQSYNRDLKRPLRQNRMKKDTRDYLELDNTMSDELKKCYKILKQVQKHVSAYPFLVPVDPIQLQILDYHDIVKEPMDLQTIENNLRYSTYENSSQFAFDVRKIWSNSYLYNQKGSPIYQLTKEMDAYFEKLFKEVESQPSASNPQNPSVYLLQKQVEKLSKEIKELNSVKRGSHKSKKSNTKNDIPMTMNEKRLLGQNIKTLPPQYLRGVWEIVSDGNLTNTLSEKLEFDIDTLPVRKTRELENYVRAKLSQIHKSRKKIPNSIETSHNFLDPHQINTFVPQDALTTKNWRLPESKDSTGSQAPTDIQTFQNLNAVDTQRVEKNEASESSFISDTDSNEQD